jgi:hypothetical protein
MKQLTIDFDLYEQELINSYKNGFARCFELVAKKMLNSSTLDESNVKKLLVDLCDEHDMTELIKTLNS